MDEKEKKEKNGARSDPPKKLEEREREKGGKRREKIEDTKYQISISISSIISMSSIILSIKDDDGDDIVDGCVGREEVREAMLLLTTGSTYNERQLHRHHHQPSRRWRSP